MTREQAKKLLPIMQAFAEGKTIQYYCKSENPYWVDIGPNEVNQNVDFSNDTSRYRIKPKPKYRPFKNKEECWQEMLKHQPFGWVTDGPRICNIICIREDGILANTNVYGTFYEFESSINLKFADGTPFGIMEN